MTRLLLLLGMLLLTLPAQARYGYDNLYANDGRYLGNTNSNQYDANSVNNPYGRYGSQYSPDSVNNPYGQYGSRYSQTSPNNMFSPPGRRVSPSGYGQPQDYGGWSRNFGY